MAAAEFAGGVLDDGRCGRRRQLLRLAINPFVVGTQFPTFFLAAIIATFLGGVCVGLLSVALSTLSAWIFIQPHLYSFALDPGAAYALIMFAAVGTVMVSSLVRCRRPVAPPRKTSSARSR